MRAKKSTAVRRVSEPNATLVAEAHSPRVVYTEPPFVLGRVTALCAEGSVSLLVNGEERTARIDSSVDPQLLHEALATGARVVIESGAQPLVVGVLCTQRSITIDSNNRVVARLKSLRFDIEDKLLLKTPLSFLQMSKEGEVEVFGQRLISRARKVAKILAAHISLN